MASIRDIVIQGKGKVTGGNLDFHGNERPTNTLWEVIPDSDNNPNVWCYFSLYHYNTLMLRWRQWQHRDSNFGYTEVVDKRLGHGSRSDQNGMNIAFNVIDAPYRYERDKSGGGPRFTELIMNHDTGHYQYPTT